MKRILNWFVGVIAFIVVLLIIVKLKYIDGVLGNYENVISTLSSFATAAAVFAAIFIASNQRRNEKVTRNEEWFERNFSLLLEQHNAQLKEILDSTDYQKNFNSVLIGPVADFRTGKIKDVMKSLANKLHSKDSFYGSYFKVLYRLLKHIDESCSIDSSSNNSHKFYIGLVRSFIRTDVLWLLAINCSDVETDKQYIKYKEYLEKYEFFEHMLLEKEFVKAIIPVGFDNMNIWSQLLFEQEIPFSYHFIDAICTSYKESAFGRNLQYIAYKEHVASQSDATS